MVYFCTVCIATVKNRKLKYYQNIMLKSITYKINNYCDFIDYIASKY